MTVDKENRIHRQEKIVDQSFRSSFIFLACLCVVMLDMKGHMVVLGTALGTLMVPGYWSLQMG